MKPSDLDLILLEMSGDYGTQQLVITAIYYLMAIDLYPNNGFSGFRPKATTGVERSIKAILRISGYKLPVGAVTVLFEADNVTEPAWLLRR
jgi:hypothetical protein